MKIKARAEDFVVDEILDVPIEKRGAYGLYRLEKRHENTVSVLHEISKELRLPFSAFSFGGRKDKHAITRQHVTIKETRAFPRLQKKNYSLEFLGFLRKPMAPQFIKGNHFDVVVRDLGNDETQRADEGITQIKKYGFPNYFDDQRFGSLDPLYGFIAEKILKKHFNGALKIYLTRLSSEDRKEEKDRKKFFFENWGFWPACLEKATTPFEKMAFSHLNKVPKGFVPVLQKIPHEDLSLFYSTFQAYLWNTALEEMIRSKIKNSLSIHHGLAGDYLFYHSLDQGVDSFFKKLTIPTAASNIKWHDEETKKIYLQILQRHQLKLPMFNITKIRQAFFKTIERNAVVIPRPIRFEILNDDAYEGRQKLVLNFTLPRGSYATMLIKRIFSKLS
jgi:tRNA pseudouridine13 synthase